MLFGERKQEVVKGVVACSRKCVGLEGKGVACTVSLVIQTMKIYKSSTYFLSTFWKSKFDYYLLISTQLEGGKKQVRKILIRIF